MNLLTSEDEFGKIEVLAQNAFEAFSLVVGADVQLCYNILLECSGIDGDTRKAFSEMSEEKKKRLLEEIDLLNKKQQIGPKSSDGSLTDTATLP